MGYFLAPLVLQIVLCPSAHAKVFVGWGGAYEPLTDRMGAMAAFAPRIRQWMDSIIIIYSSLSSSLFTIIR